MTLIGIAPTQATMFNESSGSENSSDGENSSDYGENSSDYAGCWSCGGICCYLLTPCGDGCINNFPFLCGIPVPVCCCSWYIAGDSKGEFKQRNEGEHGEVNVMYMVDKKTIKFRPSTNPKDYSVDPLWGTTADEKIRCAMQSYNRNKECCGDCCFTYTKIC